MAPPGQGRKKPIPPGTRPGGQNHPCGARCHRTVPPMHFSRPRLHAPPVRPRGAGGERHATDGHLRLAPPPRSATREEDGGGLAWGSCGRSGRHALGRAAGASCVQRLDDSRNSAIHITYRISLRSSSMPEPRDPLLKVLTIFIIGTQTATFRQCSWLRSPAGTGPGAREAPRRPQRAGPPKQQGTNRHGWEDGHPEKGRPNTR